MPGLQRELDLHPQPPKRQLRHVQLLHMLWLQLRVQRTQVLFKIGTEAAHVVQVSGSSENGR